MFIICAEKCENAHSFKVINFMYTLVGVGGFR